MKPNEHSATERSGPAAERAPHLRDRGRRAAGAARRAWTRPSPGPAGCACAARGRIVVTGMGKSGHVAHKIAATLASTGTPAFFLHPGRGQPWRSGHDHARRSAAGAVELGRDRRGADAAAAGQAPGGAADRAHRQSALDAGARGRRASGRGRAAGGLPAQPDADREHHRGAGDGRCAGGGAARGARLLRRGFCALASGRQPRAGACCTRVEDIMRRGDALPRVRPETLLSAGAAGDDPHGSGPHRGGR